MRSPEDGHPKVGWIALLISASLAFAAGFGVAGAAFYYMGRSEPAPTVRIISLRPMPAVGRATLDRPELAASVVFRKPATFTRFVDEASSGTVAGTPRLWALGGIGADSSDVAVAAAEQLLPPENEVQEIEVEKGDTLIDILLRAGAVDADANAAIAALKDRYDPRRLRAGAQISIALDQASEPSQLQSLTIPVAFAQELKVSRQDDASFAAEDVRLTLDREDVLAAGSIEDSLYDSARAAGMPAQTIMRFVKLLSWDVDFQRDLQEGDRFEVLFDHLSTSDGRASRDDELSFARLTTGDRDIALYRFEREDGSSGWFHRDGKSGRKSLLRTPIDGARLSSGFGLRRHPVLGYSRMHKGTDFAAPRGTPIFAAGDGVIEMRGRNRGYGNYIRIKHNTEYSTAYGHMSRFSKQFSEGSKVRQGDVIGFVGTTGLSTGPHLHYEVIQRGAQINPMSIKQTFADQLTGAELARFKAERGRIDAVRRDLAEPKLVAQK